MEYDRHTTTNSTTESHSLGRIDETRYSPGNDALRIYYTQRAWRPIESGITITSGFHQKPGRMHEHN